MRRLKRPAAKQTGTAIIYSLWDERDEDYAPVDHATYSGNLWNLFEVSYIADGKENTFSYDARGNRISEIETYTGSNGRVTDYEYYENSDLIKKAGNWYFNYDKNGNLTARGTEAQDSGNELFSAWTFSETDGELWTYEYDLQNRMTKAKYSGKGSANLKERGSYVYDYRGLLVKKTYQNYNPSDLVEVENEEESKTVTEFYEYTADGKVIYNERSEDNNTKKTTYIWANTTLWCEVNEGVVYYHHTDHLGTTEVVTDSNGKVVWEAGYEAFGSILNEKGDSKFTPSYTGKFFDNASGLYYFNARWYDSELGKFTTSDPIRDGLNWWNYCNGNPLTLLDWTGLEYFNGKDWVSSSTPAQRHRNKLDITDYLIPEGNNNRPGDKIVQLKGVVIHWTGVKNQTPKETIDYWINEGNKKNGRPGSAQFVVGIDGKIFRAIPEDEFAKHSGENQILNYLYTDTAKSLLSDGKETVNYFLLGIEMEPNQNEKEGGGFDQRTIESTSLLTAYFFNKYDLNAETDLYRHYDMTGKDCPLYYVDDEKWKKFVDMVKEDQNYLKRSENE